MASSTTSGHQGPETSSETSWAQDLVEAIQLPQSVQELGWLGQPLAAIVPKGARVEVIVTGTPEERYRAGEAPVRPSGNALLHDTDSFIYYVNKHDAGRTEIFACMSDMKQANIQAIFDSHLHTKPGWLDFRATLLFQPDRNWKEWTEIDRKSMTQETFVNFLEDHLGDIVSPAAATVLEACTNLDVTTKASFRSRIRLQDGTQSFGYSEDQNTGQVKIPTEMTLRLSPWANLPAYSVPARIRTQLKEQKLLFTILLQEPERIAEDAIKEEVAKIDKAVLSLNEQYRVVYGHPSHSLI